VNPDILINRRHWSYISAFACNWRFINSPQFVATPRVQLHDVPNTECPERLLVLLPLPFRVLACDYDCCSDLAEASGAFVSPHHRRVTEKSHPARNSAQRPSPG
jgi:hypothetical protein